MVDALRLWIFILTTLLLASCDFSDEKILPPNSGRSGDLVVVMDSISWSGEAGQAVYNCFAATQPGLPQREPLFNVINVDSRNFTQIFKTTRNIIIASGQEVGDKAKFALQNDLWAKDQLVMLIFEKDRKKVADIITQNCEDMRLAIQKKEYDRMQKAFKKLKSAESASLIKEKIGVEIDMPADYQKAIAKNNLVWFKKEFEHKGHFVNMGLLMYSIPYTSTSDFSDSLLLSEFDKACQYIQGPSEGSHMVRYEELPPSVLELNVKNNYVKEMRGLWRMSVDFMGGPFVNYAFVDASGKKMVCLTGYVFAPKFDKREYLRELEAISLSAVGS